MITVEDLEFDTTLESSADFNFMKNKKVGEQQDAEKSEQVDEESYMIEEPDASGLENKKLYEGIIYCYNIFAIPFGGKIGLTWDKNREPLYWVTWISLMAAHGSFTFTLYSHYKNGDKRKMIEPLSIAGNFITLQVKWIIHIIYFDVGYSLMLSPKKIIRVNPNGVRADIIGVGLKRTKALMKVFGAGETLTLFIYFMAPLKFYLVDNIKLILIPITIPFVDENTTQGYIIVSLLQVLLGVYNGLATSVFASGFLIPISNYGIYVDLIGQDFKDLDRMWERPNETSASYRYAYLVNICWKFQDLHCYIMDVKKMYQLKFFIYFVISYFGQILCLYQITENNWIPGYTWAFTIFIEMFFYCYVGTQLSVMDDKLCNYIESSKWYTYDIKSQKLFPSLLHQAQKPNEIMLGSIGPLNLVTGINVVKGIYTYYTVLTEML